MNWPIKFKRSLLMIIKVALVLFFIGLPITLVGLFVFPEHLALIQWSWIGLIILITAGLTWHLYKRCESGEILFDNYQPLQTNVALDARRQSNIIASWTSSNRSGVGL